MSNQTSKKKFLSLRYKLLIPLMSLGILMFIMGYLGAHEYLSNTINRIMNEDVESIRDYVMECLDVDKLAALNSEGWPQGLDNPRYQEQQTCVASVYGFNPRAWVYTYYVVDPKTMAFGLDMWNTTDPENGSPPGYTFTEADGDFNEHLMGLEKIHTYDRLVYDEIFNVWYYATTSPLKNSKGETVGGLAIYLDASWAVERLQILSNSLLLIFAGVFSLVAILVLTITRRAMSQLGTLQAASRRVAEGDYTPIVIRPQSMEDEISTLADLFNTMLDKVEEREETLQTQVEELKLQIDHEKRNKDVKEIVDSQFFRDLKERAAEVRRQRAQKE